MGMGKAGIMMGIATGIMLIVIVNEGIMGMGIIVITICYELWIMKPHSRSEAPVSFDSLFSIGSTEPPLNTLKTTWKIAE